MRTPSRLSDDVYVEIKKKILSASIINGERLYETVVAQDFAASRTPVREALMRLLEEGLLERQGRAYTVREISPAEMIDLYTVRQQLESLSVSIASTRMDEARMRKLEEYILLMGNALSNKDKLRFNSIDSDFHMLIAESTENRNLIDILFGIHEKVRLVRNSLAEFIERLPGANEEHSLILNALKRREPRVASAEMDAHIQSTIDFLRQLPPSRKADAETRDTRPSLP